MNTENLISWSDIVADLITMQDSTTLYLEALRKSTLRVKLVHQQENDMAITRISKLYFSTCEMPVIYSVSHIHKHLLTDDEYRLITTAELPLGHIFTTINPLSAVYKENIAIEHRFFENEIALMQLKESTLYKKKYDFLIGSRKVAVIEEFFNLESLQRY